MRLFRPPDRGRTAKGAAWEARALARVFIRMGTWAMTFDPAPSRGWRGPAARFRLVVDKGASTDLVAFCPLAARKTAPTTFEWSASDFTVDKNIGALFFVDLDTLSYSTQE